ncbi:MAG: hypothetical protein KKB51_14380 [Candidatus Riflebacteria bacterium]|nr:hypothetical protein [Candidatus Riflebacteria bacterium]
MSSTDKGKIQKEPDKSELEVIKQVKSYLEDAEIKCHDVSNDAVELYMQGHNLTMHVVIYVHNGHLIFRIPGFIRNVELRRLDIMQFLMQVMNDILDIRFELGKEGKSLSACCQHILEDSSITRRQFDLAMMVLIHIVDDTYPHLMKLIYKADADFTVDDSEDQSNFSSDDEDKPVTDVSDNDESDENDEFAPIINDEETRKIN